MTEMEKQMKLIVAVDKNWAIGHNDQLLVSIPSDKRYFRELTKDQVVIMGRKTFEGLPNGLPLDSRINVILTSQNDFQKKGIEVANTVEEVLEIAKKYSDKEIFVIGGQTIYEQFLPYCTEAYVTKIDYSYSADRYCPNLDENDDWEMIGISEEETYYDLEYYFCKYVKKVCFR